MSGFDVRGPARGSRSVRPRERSRVSVFLGAGDGCLCEEWSWGSEAREVSVAAGDLDGDGVDDLAVGTGNATYVRWGIRGGTLVTRGHPRAGPGYAIAVADLDGDGIADLLLRGGAHDPESSVVLGTGKGTFDAPFALSTSRSDAALVVDLDGDGSARSWSPRATRRMPR